MSSIKVSIIIPVYNEAKYISKLTDSLTRQDFPADNMECLFIDGGSTDSTKEILENAEFPFKTRILDNPDKTPPFALNKGIENAEGEYIIRMDAHSVFPENYIRSCIEVLEETDADNVGGIANTEAEGYIGKAIAKILQSPFGVGNSSFRTGDGDRETDTVPFGTFRKSLFDRIGNFDTDLVRSEDNDFNARIIQNGGKVWLSNKIRFTYFCRDNVADLLKMALKNGNALPFTLKKNRSAMRIRHFIPLLFFLSLILLPLLGILLPVFYIVLLCELGLYLLLDIYFSFFKEERKLGFATFWLFPLFHIFYGIGSLIGFLGYKLY